MYARIFIRLLAAVYLIAFWSIGSQVLGLIGSQGILPAYDFLARAAAYWGPQHIWQEPTLCWFNSSDTFLLGLCLAGCFCSVLLFIGFLPWACAFLLWTFYLSLVVVGQDFLGFQWDNLLLEAGFLAIFLFPFSMSWRWSCDQASSKIVIWLLRLLLFKLMFSSGAVKWVSHDPTWANLTALTYHYLTQPLPNIISWYFYQLPVWFHKLSCLVLFVVELVVPFLIFCGRRARKVAFGLLVALQLLIILTGNYCFFNILTIALCFTLLDDNAFILKKVPLRHTLITLLLAVAVLIVSARDLIGTLNLDIRPFAQNVVRFMEPFRTVNSYGLFAVMTTKRDEIMIEGSQDSLHWKEYKFVYKPQDLDKAPCWVMPFQPRLDWQMWFAALGHYQENLWIINLMVRLLQGSKPVLNLFQDNPFGERPPQYIRAIMYEYQFTDYVSRWKTKAWWDRTYVGPYTPVISLNDLNT